MSLKLGGSKSKSSSTQTSNFSNTTTPLVPEWARSLTEGVASRVADVNRLDPRSLVAPANGLHDRAAVMAGDLTGLRSTYDTSGGLLGRAAAAGAYGYQPTMLGGSVDAGPESLLDNLDAYMSPYRRQVVDAALADYDFGAGQTRAQQDLDLAGSGAFGGSGYALTRAMTEDALARGRATTSANLLDQMYQQGAALSSQDAERRQQAGLANAAAANQYALANAAAANDAARYNAGAEEQMWARRADAARSQADIATAYETNQRANIAAQAQMAELLRGIDAEQRQAPVTSAQQVVALLNGLPISLFTGQQQTGSQTGTSNSTTKGSEWGLGASISGPLGSEGWKLGG